MRKGRWRQTLLCGTLAAMMSLNACAKEDDAKTTAAAASAVETTGSTETTPEQTTAPETSAAVTTEAPATEAPTEESTAAPTTEAPTTTEEKTTEAPMDFYDKMIADSFIQTGNTARMHKIIEKAKQGEDVTIAYIGGSITEGALATTQEKTYARLSYQYFADTFGTGENVHFLNAGFSGTPSTLGIIRYDRDMLTRGYTTPVTYPDIIFIEFAVNDGDDPTFGEAYESMIRQALNAPNEPAVFLLFSVFESEFNLQDRLMPLGKHYDLPMISIKNAVIPQIHAGNVTNREFFAKDGYHPMDYGHQIMCDCITYCFDRIAEAEPDASYTVPETTVIGNSFENMTMIDTKTTDPAIVINPGSFTAKDKTSGVFQFDNKREKLGDNWSHTKDGGSESFTMRLNCKSLIMAYKRSNNKSAAGAVEVLVDGEPVKPLISPAFNQKANVARVESYSAGGWNNPWLAIILDEETAADHTIEVKMAEGDEEKEFTIFAFG
ncbi:MAG: SGNH/GDSL hydrolase family protein, partial [Lachnospiraceae bacterium]|nr:SGNH/GDSL hydrolase family protein [Lachnospiraceae bacterium]